MLLLSAAILTASCTQKGGAPDADTKHVITVTLEPLRYFAEQIAGEHFRVVSMVPEGSSPEPTTPHRNSWWTWPTARPTYASATSDSNRYG